MTTCTTLTNLISSHGDNPSLVQAAISSCGPQPSWWDLHGAQTIVIASVWLVTITFFAVYYGRSRRSS